MSIETYSHTATKKLIKTQVDYNALLIEQKDVAQDEREKLMSNIKALRIISFALPSDTFRLVSTCETTKEIWDRLKELYLSDVDLEHLIQTMLLSSLEPLFRSRRKSSIKHSILSIIF